MIRLTIYPSAIIVHFAYFLLLFVFYSSPYGNRLSMYYVHIMSHTTSYISYIHISDTYIYIHTSVQKNSSQYKEAIRTKMHFNRKSISCPLGQLCTDNCLNSIYVCIQYICTSIKYIVYLYKYVCLDTNVPPCVIRIMCIDNARLGEEFMKILGEYYRKFQEVLYFKVLRELHIWVFCLPFWEISINITKYICIYL